MREQDAALNAVKLLALQEEEQRLGRPLSSRETQQLFGDDEESEEEFEEGDGDTEVLEEGEEEVDEGDGNSDMNGGRNDEDVEVDHQPLTATPDDLRAGLSASILEADVRTAPLNAQINETILRTRLAPEHVAILEVTRTPHDLVDTLMEAHELEEQRKALKTHELPIKLRGGALAFVRPDHHAAVLQAIEHMDLKPRHIVVALEFEKVIREVIGRVGQQVAVKRQRTITATSPHFGDGVHATISRTFVHLEIPNSSMPDSSRHPATT